MKRGKKLVKVSLPGSSREPVGARIGDIPNDEEVEVSIILHPKKELPAPSKASAPLSRKAFAAKYGAGAGAIRRVKDFAKQNGLTVTEVSAERRTVKLAGTVDQMRSAFDVQLDRYEVEGCVYRARTGDIHVPKDLAGSIEAVLGLDDRPQARAHFRVYTQPKALAKAKQSVSYNPRQVAQIYQFPLDVDGTGQTIAILELGGGYKLADLTNYFSSIGVKAPSVTAVLVDKAKNKPTNSNSADGEVLLDIEVCGAVAPGAKIVVYFAPNTTQGFQDALTTAIHSTKYKASAVSISWGGPESTWTAQSMTAFDSAAKDAAALGITICAASGDNGSSDGETDGKNHVDFPASSPNVLACGGTSLRGSGSSITSETVWNGGSSGGATGGGFSAQFPLPSWQSSAGVKPPPGGGRGVPDVSGDADPQTGYQVLVDGVSLVIGGTSAVAPLWAGLIALLNEKMGKTLGLAQPALYAVPSAAGAFHDITQGSNGSFSAGPGWDAATGLGSPLGEKLLQALSAPKAKPVKSKKPRG